MIHTVIGFFICVFQVSVFYDFLHDLLEKRMENKIITITTLGVMSVLLFDIKHVQILQVNLVAVVLLFLLGTVFLFCGNLKKRIWYCLMFYVVMTGMELLVRFFCTRLMSLGLLVTEPYSFKNFILIIITKLLSYVVLQLIKMFLNWKEVRMKGKFLRIAFLFSFITILFYIILFYFDIQIEAAKIIVSVECIATAFLNINVFYSVQKLAFAMEENKKYEWIDLKNTYDQEYYERLKAVKEKRKQYIYNVTEYLQTISALAKKYKSEEILDILKDTEEKIDSVSDGIYTNNDILNALLVEKELQAQKEKIEFQIMIEPGLNLENIDNVDLVDMVGNLIDNAIEAAALCEGEKKIDLKFFESDGNFIVLDLENTYGNKLKREGENYLTTKKDEGKHGIGIRSVRETAEKYGGLLFQEQKEDVFVSILTLSKLYWE